jgi:hypothetical protein
MTAATWLGALGTFEAEAAPEELAAGPIGWIIGGAILLAIGGLAIAAAMHSSNQTYIDAPPSGTQPGPLADNGTGILMATAQPETLSAAEEEAIRAKNAGEPYDAATYNRARQKQIKNEKYAKERNKQKRGG